MKLKSIFVSMCALAALASCNNDNEGLDNEPSGLDEGAGAYLSVAINMPSSVLTRAVGDAGPGAEAGVDAENEVKDVYLLTYKNGIRVGGLRSLTPEERGTIGVGTTAATAGVPIKVDKDVNEVFVVINPSAKTLSSITLNANKSALTTAIEEGVNDLMAAGFMMTSDSGFVAVTPSVAVAETTAAIQEAQNKAKDNPVKIGVDRAVVKTKLEAFTSNAINTTNGTASVDGWKLNTTNTKYFPYAELVAYSKTDAKYRKDPNYTNIAMTPGKPGSGAAIEFNWLHNNDTVVWNNWTVPTNNIEYCLENTMDAGGTNQNYGNTTKMIIKAQFAPTGVKLGNSWFRVGGVVKTFDQLQADYQAYVKAAATGDAGAVANKDAFDKFAVKLASASEDSNKVTWTTFDQVTLDGLNKIPNGGYYAATVNPCLIEYFQNSVCYYDVNLKHDNRVEPFLLGRWGVVRNNAYTVTINKITQPGLPYIPDPTDPDIVDPSNPDPTTPDDQESAFIAVSIKVNNWTTWSQGVEL